MIMSNWKYNTNNFKKDCFCAREVFLRALNEPLKAQKNTLKDILSSCESSRFGKKHRIEKNLSENEFKNRVPISDYTRLEEHIDSLSTNPVKRWLTTSGSTGKNKLIPYTEH
jgi:hypothetical protein